MMQQVRRSILSSQKLKAGTILTEEMLCVKRPGIGIAPEFESLLLGRKLKRDIEKEEPIMWDDI